MVDYSEDPRPRRRRDFVERRAARAAARNEEDWHVYARNLCYRLLAAQERSRRQLRDAMERNLVPDEIAQATLQAFVDAGLVDDERFAYMYVRSKFEGKVTTRRVLAQELRAKGVEGELAQRALEQITVEDELEAAIAFARKKAASMAGLEEEKKRRRLYGALGRRGFSPEHIRQAMEAALG
ncbi:regulatory protein RecX [Trueperella bernardiae]|uniref:Regulatory protein RecX n=1 Tax=Trueperella bernardiae TaxID=59561 RepID=A0A0W1KLB0_9ACTO|nr:regulatory protein RecX [Trueperella bernardiae]KTF04794.1 Regulatory protein RecX [Trueperella bernardiae]MCM3907291.1 recombination regulator RecX [Trueperella bernardiae]